MVNIVCVCVCIFCIAVNFQRVGCAGTKILKNEADKSCKMGLAIWGCAALSVSALEREQFSRRLFHTGTVLRKVFCWHLETTGHRDEVGPKVIFSLALLVAGPQNLWVSFSSFVRWITIILLIEKTFFLLKLASHQDTYSVTLLVLLRSRQGSSCALCT